jgi:hypothetical protein
MNVSNWVLIIYLVSAISCAVLLAALKCRVRKISLFKRWEAARTRIFFGVLPATSIVSSLILVLVGTRNQHNGTTGCSDEELQMKPDVGGIGVLLGLFLPCGLLFLVLVSGHFKGNHLV